MIASTGLRRLVLLLIPGLALILGLAGCGYNLGWVMEERAPGARTIAVTIPGNLTFRRDIEVDFARVLARRVAQETPWSLAEPETADLLLEGEITSVREGVISETIQDDVFESSVTITVSFRFVDLRSGKTLREFTVSDREDFVVDLGQDVASAGEDAFQDLADKVVYQLEDPF
jgi:hypothetical protein